MTCFGNSGAVQSAENSIRLVKLSKCGYEVPVVIGADCSIDGVYEDSPKHIHGDNGIGNVILPESDQKPLPEEGADFIIRKAKELDGDLIIVSTGRLTNLANALAKEPRLPKMIKKLVTMGGVLYGPGNVTNYAEANIYGDARAADLVFRAGFHMYLVGLDVTQKTFITEQELDDLDQYCKEDCQDIAKYIRDVLKLYFEFHRSTQGMVHRSFVHDPLAMLIAEDPRLGKYEMIVAGVEYQAPAFRGMILQDKRFLPAMDHDEIAFCVEVDSERAIRRLFSVFQKEGKRFK